MNFNRPASEASRQVANYLFDKFIIHVTNENVGDE